MAISDRRAERARRLPRSHLGIDDRDAQAGSGDRDLLEVLHDRERLVEVVQQSSPLLVLGRLAEAHGVVIELRPLNEQEIHGRLFEATRQRESPEARDARDDCLGLDESRLEAGPLAGLHGQ